MSNRTVDNERQVFLQKLLDPNRQVREKAERDAYRRAHATRVAQLADGEQQTRSWATRVGKPFTLTKAPSFLMRDAIHVSMTVTTGVFLRVELTGIAMTEVTTHLAFEGMEGSLRKHLGTHKSIAEALKAVDVLVRAVMVLNLSDMRVLIGMVNAPGPQDPGFPEREAFV